MPEVSPTGTEELTQTLQARLRHSIQDHAEFRLSAQRTFSQMEARLRDQEQALQNNDRYIHQLHVDRDELKKAVAEARADVEKFSHLLANAEVKLDFFKTAQRSSLWWLVKPFFKLARRSARGVSPAEKDLPTQEFTYFLHASPFRIYRREKFVLKGWILPPHQQSITAIRVRIDQSEFPARLDLPEIDVVKKYNLGDDARPGFEAEFSIPTGKHRFRLEVCLNRSEWVSVLNTFVWAITDEN